MRRSTDRILTTHVGALPGPRDVWGQSEVPRARVAAAANDIVKMQKKAGIDFVNEGEITKAGNWISFVHSRLEGCGPIPPDPTRFAFLNLSADRQEFAEFYDAATRTGTLFEQTGSIPEIAEALATEYEMIAAAGDGSNR